MYDGKASNANPTSSYPPCHASMAWDPTICICEMSVWCCEALWLAATWMDTCEAHVMNTRGAEKYKVTHTNTERFRMSTVPYIQRKLNTIEKPNPWVPYCTSQILQRLDYSLWRYMTKNNVSCLFVCFCCFIDSFKVQIKEQRILKYNILIHNFLLFLLCYFLVFLLVSLRASK